MWRWRSIWNETLHSPTGIHNACVCIIVAAAAAAAAAAAVCLRGETRVKMLRTDSEADARDY